MGCTVCFIGRQSCLILTRSETQKTDFPVIIFLAYMGHVVRKPKVGVCHEFRIKLAHQIQRLNGQFKCAW